MTQAARRLNITQPTLSAAIRRIEADVGHDLFDRTGRGIRLNQCGRIFLEYALQIDRLMGDCLSDIRAEGEKQFVRMACSRAPTNSRLVSRLLAEGVNLSASTIPRNWDSELADNNLDLVITFGRTELAGLGHDLLCYQKAVVVAGRSHPLALRDVVTAEDLKRQPFCCNSAPHSLTYMARDACIAYGFDPHITFQGRDASDMQNVIRSGRCLGLMLECHLQNREDLVVLPVKDFSVSQPLFLYWRKSDIARQSLSEVRRSIRLFYQELT